VKDSEILIIGSNGQLGLALQEKYPNAASVDSDKLDITNSVAVDSFDWQDIKCIINAAGYTNVDGAETEEGKKLSWAVNDQGVKNLSEIATKHGITLVHISTDYVFDGTKSPHKEDELPSPLSEYGKSKAAGDKHVGKVPKHYLIRTSWVVGEGKNFIRTIMALAGKNVSPSVVSDQVGRLTFTGTLTAAINHLLINECKYGTYNVSNSGTPASWADITRKIFTGLGRDDLAVTDTTTEKYYKGKDNIAPRPLNSVLDLSKMENTGFEFTDWQEELVKYIKKETKQ
jgi:dTDP-4-dehydrorhamnose reductase